jgi:hypothetical protein
VRYIAIICMWLALSAATLAADKKPENVVAQSLDSIGTPEARAAVKSRSVQGTLHFKIMVGGAGETVGRWERVSQQHKSNFVMKFGSGDWSGERFVFDGDRTFFAAFTASHQRSEFGEFVRSQDFIVKEGLLGGELSTAWALENLDQHPVKLEYRGLKKVDGRELQAVEYLSKRNGDVIVRVYFDPETHRHVATVYSVSRGATIAHSDLANARQQEVRYSIEERFSDFQTDNGITLPRHYDLRYSQELQNGSIRVYDWDMTADKVLNNLEVDPGNFQLN